MFTIFQGMNVARSYPIADVKTLYALAAGRCAFPSCHILLTQSHSSSAKVSQIGEIAHIVAHSVDGPRGDSNFPTDRLDTYGNWILLCPTHHKIIDAEPHLHPISKLHQLKSDHESWIVEQLENNIAEFGFAELEVAVKAIASGAHTTNGNFHVITPQEKILKNNLGTSVKGLIVQSLSRGEEVRDYIVKATLLDEHFADRLQNGFKNKYKELKADYTGDALFFAMFEYSHGRSSEFRIQAAGLAILCHLFELCEVFEK